MRGVVEQGLQDLLLHPPLKNVRAVITTKWTRGYRPLVIRTVESYYIDQSLDNDADVWQIEIGDPVGQYTALLQRDSEVKVEIIGVGGGVSGHIVTGYADEITYTNEGTVTLNGRDLAALALDSFAEPKQYRHAKAWAIIGTQSRQIGFQRTSLLKGQQVKKLQYTDGSETYWEFWYRLIRKEKMWLWCSPNGTLVANTLNYESVPSYWFGTPPRTASKYLKVHHIPVETVEWKKTTQGRVGSLLIYGHKGDNGFLTTVADPTLKLWTKKPRKNILDTDAHTTTAAQKTGWEEIFEGKVGAIEITLTVAEPGFLIRPNRVAHVRIPEMNLVGYFFVVGVRAEARNEGLAQEVRLREIGYALSRRVPTDPKMQTTGPPKNKDVSSSLSDAISGMDEMPAAWGDYFYKAADKWHGPWDFNLFLSCLLGICHQETGFRNIRQNGVKVSDGNLAGRDGIEWHPRPSASDPKVDGPAGARGPLVPAPAGAQGPVGVTQNAKVVQWKLDFVNEPGDFGLNRNDVGVGPMQLTYQGYKDQADEMPDGKGKHDQYSGNRWHPEYNIMVAAKALRENLKATVHDAGSPDNLIWMGVSAFNKGPGGAFAGDPYAIGVKNTVYNEPGYLGLVNSAIQDARVAADAAKDNQSEGPVDAKAILPKQLFTEQQCIAEFSKTKDPLYDPPVFGGRLMTPSEQRRRKIVAAALYGVYHEPEVPYVWGGGRVKKWPVPPAIAPGTDCSGYVTYCYLMAKSPDPNGGTYGGAYTGTLWDHGKTVATKLAQMNQASPGDLMFYNDPRSKHAHVIVYVGYGHAVSHGQQSDPILVQINNYRTSEFVGAKTYTV